jgi:hypothetical protein
MLKYLPGKQSSIQSVSKFTLDNVTSNTLFIGLLGVTECQKDNSVFRSSSNVRHKTIFEHAKLLNLRRNMLKEKGASEIDIAAAGDVAVVTDETHIKPSLDQDYSRGMLYGLNTINPLDVSMLKMLYENDPAKMVSV